VPCGDNGTPPYFGLSRELWTGRRSATSRQWRGTQARRKLHGNQRDGNSGQNIGWKRYVKNKWINQESRTLDPDGGYPESSETKDGDQKSLETKDGDPESLETKELIRREWILAGQSKCAMWG